MTRFAKALSLAAVGMVLLSATGAKAEQLRTPDYRPYITEVGPPRTINRVRLDKEMQLNSDLASWIRDYGYPDVAEVQDVVPQYGWSDYEIRIFYIDRNQELAFGRVSFFPFIRDRSFVDNYGLIKFQGPLQSENRGRVLASARIGCGNEDNSLDRILAAAERSERAATMAEKAALRAMQSAERAEAAVNRMEVGFTQSLRK